MSSALLPKNATPFERAFADAADVLTLIDGDIDGMRGIKFGPPPSFLPFLVYEYGLGELTPYLPNLYDLIDAGIDWQRVRGTPAAVALALSWVGYAGAIEEPPARRRRWNLFMLEMDRIRDAESDLIRIEGVTQLSVPVRSVFWRGFKGYDVRALEYGHKRWSGALWSSYSGVRVAPGQAKWSFGRRYGIDHAMTQDELTALGVWIEPPEPNPSGLEIMIADDGSAIEDGEGNLLVSGENPDLSVSSGWSDLPWLAIPWATSPQLTRSIAMLAALDTGTAWAVFKDEDGEVIGYRRARAIHPVAMASNGIYSVGSTKFAIKDSGARILYVEALTGFGDGFGSTAASVGFILNAEPTEEQPPGALWLPEGGLQQVGPIIAETNVSIEFGRTVRERVTAALRF